MSEGAVATCPLLKCPHVRVAGDAHRPPRVLLESRHAASADTGPGALLRELEEVTLSPASASLSLLRCAALAQLWIGRREQTPQDEELCDNRASRAGFREHPRLQGRDPKVLSLE